MSDQISIIVACYNASDYIERCIESVLAQTYDDWELIVVNDGSTDDSLEKCISYSRADLRIKVFDKANGGVSSARNAGLDIAKGKWIIFVDIDDIIKPDALEYMSSHVDSESDIVFAGFEVYKNGKLDNIIPPERKAQISNDYLAKELFVPSDYHYQGFICSKLYRRSIIEKHHIRFDERIKYNEDRLFTFSFLAHARKGVYTTKPVYEYYLHGGSAMSAIEGPNYWKFETDLDAFVEMSKIAPTYGSKVLLRLVRLGAIASYNWNMRLNAKYGGNDKEATRRLRKKLLSAVPISTVVSYQISNFMTMCKVKLYNIAVKLRLK